MRQPALPVALLGVALTVACGSGESQDDTSQEDASQAKTVILEMDEFTLQPNSDGFMCQTFENPFGQDVHVTGWEFQAGSNSAHHLIVFPEPNGENTSVDECDMRAVDQILIGSQASNDLVSYPSGVGTAVTAETGLVMRIHYGNRADTPEKIDGPRLKIRYEPPEVPRVTGLYAFNEADIQVAAGEFGSATETVLAPQDIELVWMVSHYHDHGVKFTATVRGEVVYTAGDIENPPMTTVFDPPLLVKQGEPIAFQCDYQADPDRGIVFGGELAKDEMCNLKGGYVLPGGGVPSALVESSGSDCLPPGVSPPAGFPSRSPSTDGAPPSCPPTAPGTP